MPGEVFREYWQLRVNGAASQLEAARKIISHGTTRGTIAENTVRGIIAPLLPFRYSIASGFLISKDAAPSKQIDVLVFDRAESSPLYEDQACAVISPEMGVLAIEVKSTLNKKDIREAVANIASAKRINRNILTVIFAFTGFKPKTLAAHLPALVAPLPASERVDVIINLRHDYVAELDQVTRATYNCYQSTGVAVKTLLLQAIAGAKVNNLREYIDAGSGPGEPSLQIDI